MATLLQSAGSAGGARMRLRSSGLPTASRLTSTTALGERLRRAQAVGRDQADGGPAGGEQERRQEVGLTVAPEVRRGETGAVGASPAHRASVATT